MTEASKKNPPLWSPTGRELRLWLFGGLAAVYALVASLLPAQGASPEPMPSSPVEARIVVPAGWTLASRSTREPTPVTGRRARRVRTRSS